MIMEEVGKDREGVGPRGKSPPPPGWSRGDKGSLLTAGGTDTKAARRSGTSPGQLAPGRGTCMGKSKEAGRASGARPALRHVLANGRQKRDIEVINAEVES